MPAELFKEGVDLDYLEPGFRDSVFLLLANCKAKGKKYLVTEGYRSWARSHALHGAFLGGGPRAAPAGFSAHNYGLAVDAYLILKPSPKRVVSMKAEDFECLISEAKKLGLHCGMKDDLPHVGHPQYVTAKDLKPLKAVWDANPTLDDLNRLKAVWAVM